MTTVKIDDSFIDSARPVRSGEELDLPALAAFLASALPASPGGTLSVDQFPSGHSNLTYLLTWGGEELVLRRAPFGTKVKSAHDMQREHALLAALAPHAPKVPKPLLYCDDPQVIGAPFYLMERRRGIILRGPNPKAASHLSPDSWRAVSTSLLDSLAELHSLDLDAVGLRGFGHPEGYVRRQVEGWSQRYFAAKTDEVADIEALSAWLLEHFPAYDKVSTAALIHGDFKYDNVVLDPAEPTHVVAILDWEMATVGDPLMDLGTTLGYWIDPDDSDAHKMLPFGPTALPGNLNRAQVVERYAERRGIDVPHMTFYTAFALFKIAVIAQQIYQRFVEGHTQDPRFAAMLMGVRILGQSGVRLLASAGTPAG